jgi:hypothetical protein
MAAGPWAFALRAGDRIALPDTPGVWQIADVQMANNAVTLKLNTWRAPYRASPLPANAGSNADSGQFVPSPSPDPGDTIFVIVDVPKPVAAFYSTASSTLAVPGLYAAVAGTRPGWRFAAVRTRASANAPWQEAGVVRPATALGVTQTALPPASPYLEDRASDVILQLAGGHMDLTDVDPAQLLYGANLACIGTEWMSFAQSEPLGNGRYRLRHLLRGLWGTGANIGGHAPGENFVLFDGAGVIALGGVSASSAISAAAPLLVEAQSPADAEAVVSSRNAPSRSAQPLAPVHAAYAWSAGNLALSWVRRSRDGWGWMDGVDAPIGEAAELYSLTLFAPSLPALAPLLIESSTEQVLVSAALLAQFITAGAAHITAEVRQIGDFSQSLPCQISVPIP